MRDLDRLASSVQAQLSTGAGRGHLSRKAGVVESCLNVVHQIVEVFVLGGHLERRDVDVLREQHDLVADGSGAEVRAQPCGRKRSVDVNRQVRHVVVARVGRHGDPRRADAGAHFEHVNPEGCTSDEVAARDCGARRRQLRRDAGIRTETEFAGGAGSLHPNGAGRAAEGGELDPAVYGVLRNDVRKDRCPTERRVQGGRERIDIAVRDSIGVVRRQGRAGGELGAILECDRDGEIRVGADIERAGRVLGDDCVDQIRILVTGKANLFLRRVREAHIDQSWQRAGDGKQENLVGREVENVSAGAVRRSLDDSAKAERLVGEAERRIGGRR